MNKICEHKRRRIENPSHILQIEIRPDGGVVAGAIAFAGHGFDRRILFARFLRGGPDAAALDLDLLQARPERVGNEQIIDLIILARDGIVAMRPAIRSRGEFIECVAQTAILKQRRQ